MIAFVSIQSFHTIVSKKEGKKKATSQVNMSNYAKFIGFLTIRNKISIITDISVLGFYEYIGNIGKYRWIF